MEIHILELPKLSRYEYPEDELLRWARFLNAEEKEEFEMMAKEDSYIDEAYEQLVKLSADEKKRLEYEAREKAILDYNSMMGESRREGFAAGMEQGVKQNTAKYGKLVKLLAKDHKLDLLVDAAEDADLLQKLYEEYGL